MSTDIQNIYGDDFPANIKIRVGNIGTISGFLMNDFQYSFSSSYSSEGSIFNSAIKGLNDAFASGGNLGKIIGVIKQAYSQVGTHVGKNVFQSFKVWSESDMAPITTEILIIEKQTGGNLVRNALNILAKGSLSSLDGSVASDNIGLMHAPLNYGFLPNSNSDSFMKVGYVEGSTCTLEIGNNGSNKTIITGLVIDSTQIVESKSRTTEGRPNWIMVRLTLSHYKTVLSSDFIRWVAR